MESHYLAVCAVIFFFFVSLVLKCIHVLLQGRPHASVHPTSDLVLLELCSAVVNKGFHFVEHLHVICSMENAL